MEKMKMQTPDGVEMNIDKVAALFPGCITETRDDDGNVTRAVDFDLLRQELSADVVEGPAERYSLNWPGKRKAIAAANSPINKTLRPCREESVDFDTTENLYIEGDNLDALKLLQETYLGKVKMIYIDPPYNTGKDFIYKDNFTADKEEYERDSGQRDEEGGRLVANPESNGRHHSDWLSMMFPRLKLARTLLRDDGVMFISIDDNEVHNLRRICDVVFGQGNFLSQFAWRTDGNFDNQAKFKKCHEYILVYGRDATVFPHPPVIDPNVSPDSKIYKAEIRNTIVKNGPKNPQSQVVLPAGFPASFEAGVIEARDSSWPHYLENARIENSCLVESVTVSSGWSSKDLLEDFIKNNCAAVLDLKGQSTVFYMSQTGAIEAVKERSEDQSHVISLLSGFGGPQKAVSEIEELGVAFDDYPKPVALIEYFTKMNRGDAPIILDFFSGSATTAHAVLKINAEDGSKRKFILVQLPEACGSATKAYEEGYKTIAEIGKERIRRAGQKIKEENATTAADLDIGFRVLKVDSSNMKDVWYTPDELKQDELDLFTDHIKEGRTSEDLLFQIMLDWGSPTLDAKIRTEKVGGKTVYIVNENDILACFEEGLTEELVKQMAALKPLRAVFRDDAFDDSLKVNVEQIFKVLSPGTEVKSI